MENRGRRGRRSRCYQNQSAPFFGVKCLVATVGVVCLACSMLQYNCRNCQSKQELMKLTSSVENIAKQLNEIQSSYQLLEDKITVYSQELPKLEKQMAVFDALAQIIEANRIGWNPRINTALPYVDVKLLDLKKPVQKVSNENTTKTSKIRNVKNNSKVTFGNRTINKI